uniref:Uncharacterized protein n=1 Tax=viral metagenome TaxID=1070528 RepID=A0A6C0KZD7_9ZZZZ
MSFRSVQGDGVEAQVRRDTQGRILVSGHIRKFQGRQIIEWVAPNLPTRGIGFNGSGLPFANSDQAYERTPNRGKIDSPDGSFTINLNGLPNAYYTGLGSTYVPPVLMLETVGDHGKHRCHVFLSPIATPYRWIAGAPPGPKTESPDEIGRAMYYNGRESLGLFTNQEALLRAKGYPADEAMYGLPDTIDAKPWLHTPAPA